LTGRAARELATTLLQRMRRAAPEGGVWEAADVQWWSRQARTTDSGGQQFWLGADGEPEAAVLRTDFGGEVQCDVLVGPGGRVDERAVWAAACEGADARVVFPVRGDWTVGAEVLEAAGFAPDAAEPGVVSAWLAAGDRPPAPPMPPGYRLRSRADAPDGPHPMAARNGAEVEERLRECSLYEPALDLMVTARPMADWPGTGCSGPTR
jgi:hypothetical protein